VHNLRVGPDKRHAYQHGPTDALEKPAADESISTRNTQIRNPLERMADHGSQMLASVSTPAPAIMLTTIMLPQGSVNINSAALRLCVRHPFCRTM
jgi:hypothetical protein